MVLSTHLLSYLLAFTESYRRICSHLLVPPPPSTLEPKGLYDLVLEIVGLFQPKNLSDACLQPSWQPQVRKTPEALFAHEFYRAAHSSLHGLVYLSPEFGNCNKTHGSGFIDLYIPGYKFGIEYVREGNTIAKHYERFLPGGNYHQWVQSGDIIEYVVLDFRGSHPRTPHPGELTI